MDEEEAIRWLGRAQGGPIITKRERRVEVVDIEDFGELLLDDLRQRLPNRYKNRLDSGVLPPATGMAVVQSLIEMYPHLAETVDRLTVSVDLNGFDYLRGHVAVSSMNSEMVWGYCLT